MSKTTIYIISGKNPLEIHSGYSSYSYNLGKILTDSGFQVKIFCFGSKNEFKETEVGTIYVFKSNLLKLLRGREMAGLLFFAPKIAFEIKKRLQKNKNAIIWG